MLSIVDGAHAPGHVQVDLEALGADIYAGNCHKWLCAPKSAGFLWARPEHQGWIEPLVISWGYREKAFADRHAWAGTRDPAAYLSVPKAIEVHATFDLDGARVLADRAEAASQSSAIHACRALPRHSCAPSSCPSGDSDELWARLYEEFRVEAPVYEWGEKRLLRVSIGPYNDEEDVERLVSALSRLL